MMPTMRSLVSRVIAPLVRAVEGAERLGPWTLPVSGGWLSAGPPSYGESWNWWQRGGTPVGGERSAIVEACVAAYSQTVAMCPGDHWRQNSLGGRDRVTTSALSRILRAPNDYQTISDFLLNATRSLCLYGNCYALALRDGRFEVSELHLFDANQSGPQVIRSDDDEVNGEIFYRLGGNDVIGQRLARSTREQLIVPARDVLHIRLHSDRRSPRPLVGETPLAAAYGDLLTYENIKNQQNQFYQNQARPSAVLTTDLTLDKDQVAALRDRWLEQSKGLHAGGVTILTSGLKVMPWTAPAAAKDMQVAELLKLTQDQIALVFRVPLAILGLGAAPFSGTEALLNFWLASGLGFCLNHIEKAFDQLFGLEGEPTNYCEFSTDALLRSDRKDRVEALARSIQGGLLSPNEARAQEGYDAQPFGAEVRLQAQCVPLSAAAGIPSAPAAPAQPAVPLPAAKSYEGAVQRDLDALMARSKRPEPREKLTTGSFASSNRAAESRVVRKVRANGLQQ